MSINIQVVFPQSSNGIFSVQRNRDLVTRAATEWGNFLQNEPSPTQVLAGTVFNFSPPEGTSFSPNTQWYQSSITEQIGFNGIRIYATETNFAPSNSSTSGEAGALVAKFAPTILRTNMGNREKKPFIV